MKLRFEFIAWGLKEVEHKKPTKKCIAEQSMFKSWGFDSRKEKAKNINSILKIVKKKLEEK